jgi:predicted permease
MQARATPGVGAATLSSHTPFNGSESGFGGTVEGYVAPGNGMVDITRVMVDPSFFDVMGIPLRAGRQLTSADAGSGGGVRYALVNEAFARDYGAGTVPVGRHIYRGAEDKVGIEIVGVVRDTRFNSFREPTPPIAYFPFTADTTRIFPGALVLRVNPSATRVATDIRAAIAAVDPRLEILSTRYLQAQINSTIANERVVAALSGFFGVLALLLAMIGLYGVMTYAVTRRTREIGVRIALGAESRGVIALVLRETLTLVLLGAAIGVPAAFAAGRLGEALLFGLRPSDPSTMILAAAILFAVALVAGLLPARRATRVDPLTALRAE